MFEWLHLQEMFVFKIPLLLNYLVEQLHIKGHSPEFISIILITFNTVNIVYIQFRKKVKNYNQKYVLIQT